MINSDWQYNGTLQEIRNYMGLMGLQIGWNESTSDTMLITPNPIDFKNVERVTCTLYVWNQTQVRKKLAALLGEPVTRLTPPAPLPPAHPSHPLS